MYKIQAFLRVTTAGQHQAVGMGRVGLGGGGIPHPDYFNTSSNVFNAQSKKPKKNIMKKITTRTATTTTQPATLSSAPKATAMDRVSACGYRSAKAVLSVGQPAELFQHAPQPPARCLVSGRRRRVVRLTADVVLSGAAAHVVACCQVELVVCAEKPEWGGGGGG